MAYLTWLAFSDLLMKPVSLSRWVMALKESGLVWGDWRATYGWGIQINTNPLISFSICYDLKYLTPVCSCLPECISERSKGHSWGHTGAGGGAATSKGAFSVSDDFLCKKEIKLFKQLSFILSQFQGYLKLSVRMYIDAIDSSSVPELNHTAECLSIEGLTTGSTFSTFSKNQVRFVVSVRSWLLEQYFWFVLVYMCVSWCFRGVWIRDEIHWSCGDIRGGFTWWSQDSGWQSLLTALMMATDNDNLKVKCVIAEMFPNTFPT